MGISIISWKSLSGAAPLFKGPLTLNFYVLYKPQLQYSGKFSYGANYRIFRISVLYMKIKTTKIHMTLDPTTTLLVLCLVVR